MHLFLLLGFLFLSSACTSPPPPLEPAYDSPDALAQAVLGGFAAGDAGALRRVALTEAEFRQRVWPELPASRPERNLPFSYVWGDLQQKSNSSLARLLARYRGQRFTLASVRFEDRTAYQTYVVHRESVFSVRDEAGGEARELRLCGSMIEQAGRWKVFSYVVDD